MKKVLILVASVLAVLIVAGILFLRPVPMQVKRTASIKVPAAEVFAKVVDFHQWPGWSPWLVAEPDTKIEISGDGKSVGAIYSWEGEIVGTGEIEHINIEEGKSLDLEIRFTKPFESTSKVAFRFEEDPQSGHSTLVTWSMDGKIPKVMATMMGTMVAMDYDRGLSMLKSLCETGEIHSKTEVKGTVERPAVNYIGIQFSCKMEAIEEASGKAFHDFKAALEKAGIPVPPEFLSVYSDFDLEAREFGVISGCAVESLPNPLPEGLVSGTMPAHDAFQVEHKGSFKHLGNGWFVGLQRLHHQGLKQNNAIKPYETYPANWEEIPAQDILTKIYFPQK